MKQFFTTLLFLLATVVVAQVKPSKTTSAFSYSPFQTQIEAPTERNCYTTEYEKYLLAKHPDRLTTDSFEHALAQQIDLQKRKRIQTEEVYRIPVVVHVVHNGESIGSGANISQAQVTSQIDILNEDFRRLGGGFNNDPRGADILVEFYLALTDEDGTVLPEPGINRVDGEQSFWEPDQIDNQLKPNTYWDPNRYFNVWVVNFGGSSSDLLGYAQFPSLSGLDGLNSDGGLAETDGVVIRHQAFGLGGSTQGPFNGGRTMTHEVGHWLGLRHIWGDGDCSVDDFCADTPNAAEPNGACPAGTDSCVDSEGVDMIENYMDYTHDACMNIFTQDQKARMRAVLEVSPRRSSLISLSGCYNASVSTTGLNTASDEGWYSFSATQDTIITVSSIGSTALDTRALFVQETCENGIFFESDDELGSLQSQFSTLLLEGETLLFSWRNKTDDTDISYNLTLSELETGKVCALAQEAVSGTNNIVENAIDMYWAAYTVSGSNQAVTFSSSTDYQIFTGSCYALEEGFSGNGSKIITNLQQGEEVFLRFQTLGSAATFNISEAPLTPGQGCSTAVSAVEGINTHAGTPHWYSFTMPEFGDLGISSVGETTEDTYLQVYDACDGNPLRENDDFDGTTQSELLLKSLNAGDEVFIFWSEQNSTAGFNWTLEVIPAIPGTVCEVPVAAQIGQNIAEFQPGSQISWFSFTMPEADKKLTISSASSEVVAIATADCDNLEIISANEGSTLAVGLSQSEEVLIAWILEGETDVTWNLAVEDILPGEVCQLALPASTGVNTASEAPQWFSYTVEVDGIVRISSAGSEVDTYLVVYDECDGNLLGENDDIDFSNGAVESRLILTDMQEGTTIKIGWIARWSTDGFNWEIENRAANEGEGCTRAIDAEIGINEALSAPYWFSYTVPIEGDVVITTNGLTNVDTDLVIYDACGGSLVGANDDINGQANNFQSEVKLTAVPSGTTLFIGWLSTWSTDGFDWELRLENTGNTAPEVEDQSFTISEPFENAKPVGTVLASDIDMDELSFNLAKDQTQAFAIDAQTGDITIADGTLVSLFTETLLVEVNDGVFKSTATITISKILDNRAPEIENQSFGFKVPGENGKEIGMVEAYDINEDELTFEITSGNESGAYSLNQTSGMLSIADVTQIDESISDVLSITVSDAEFGATADITIEKIPLSLEKEEFKVYPNPTKGFLFLPSSTEILDLKLFSLEGKEQHIVRTKEYVNLSQLKTGIYLLTIETASGTILKKIVLE